MVGFASPLCQPQTAESVRNVRPVRPLPPAPPSPSPPWRGQPASDRSPTPLPKPRLRRGPMYIGTLFAGGVQGAKAAWHDGPGNAEGRDSMDTFVIEGGHRLFGRVRINGSKNAALPMLATALLTDQRVVLRDVPVLADIKNMLKLLTELGCGRDGIGREGIDGGVVSLRSADETLSHAR